MPARVHNFRIPSHPLLRALYVLIGGIVLIGAAFMGAVLLAVALGVGLILGLIALLRVWWLGRGRSQPARRRAAQEQPGAGHLLDAEYSVVAERDERDGRGP